MIPSLLQPDYAMCLSNSKYLNQADGSFCSCKATGKRWKRVEGDLIKIWTWVLISYKTQPEKIIPEVLLSAIYLL